MKTVFNIVLFLCAAGLAYVCYDSIRGPAGFRQKKEAREKAVAARLADIRKAQQAYCGQHNGRYAASFDTLIAFVKTARPASLQGFDADSLRFIPFGGNRQFEMTTRYVPTTAGDSCCLLEVKAPCDAYLHGLDRREIARLKASRTEEGKYCGLSIGSLETGNDNVGSME